MNHTTKLATIYPYLILVSFIPLSASALDCPLDSPIYNTQQEKLFLPHVVINKTNRLLAAQLNLLKSQHDYHFQLSHLTSLDAPATELAIYQPEQALLQVPSLCVQSEIGHEQVTQVQLQVLPYSKPLQFILKSASDAIGQPLFNWAIAENKGSVRLQDRQTFDQLADTGDLSGVVGVRELKFVLIDLQTQHPSLFFINSVTTPLHYDFVRHVLHRYQGLNYDQGRTQFSAETYFRENRTHLVGSIIAYDHFSGQIEPHQSAESNGLYTLEFWPTDPVPARLIEQAYRTVSAAMPFLPTALAYHPVGNTHEQTYQAFSEAFSRKGIRTIRTHEIFGQLDSAILNKGEAYGRLKIIHPSDPNPSEDIIAIYTFIPNTLGHVGGIITEALQTPLSHINLKARQNNTPNAYIKDVSTLPKFTALIGEWVHYRVSDQGITLELATEAEALTWLAGQIPTEITHPQSDLSQINPMPLAELGFSDWVSIGVKSANVAELGSILPAGMAPKGYALPFALYDQFMHLPRCKNNLTQLCDHQDSLSLYEHIRTLLKETSFQKDKATRTKALATLRETIEQAEAPQLLIDKIERVRFFWEPSGPPFKQKLRVRSSTNNEDLSNFNGAGLYSSFTHKPKEGKLIHSIQQVWASLWNERAFEERRIHRIDHLQTYMGVLIHPNYGDEQANGVAITKNIYNAGFEGMYINAQYGEISITNPEPMITETGIIQPIPDEFMITRLPGSTTGFIWETQFIRYSNINTVYDAPVTTDDVLTTNEINYLRDNLRLIHQHFKHLYHPEKLHQANDNFAMDIEFKITETTDGSRGKLAIKQARPWVD